MAIDLGKLNAGIKSAKAAIIELQKQASEIEAQILMFSDLQAGLEEALLAITTPPAELPKQSAGFKETMLYAGGVSNEADSGDYSYG